MTDLFHQTEPTRHRVRGRSVKLNMRETPNGVVFHVDDGHGLFMQAPVPPGPGTEGYQEAADELLNRFVCTYPSPLSRRRHAQAVAALQSETLDPAYFIIDLAARSAA